MDTLIFVVLLVAALVVIRVRTRWIVISTYAVAFIAVGLLFAHHVTSTLDLNF